MNATPKRSAGPQSGRSASLRWWADGIAVGLIGIVGGTVALLRGEAPATAVALFALAAVAASYAKRSRLEFRRGWRQGYESAVRTALEYKAGKVPGVEARAVVMGDAIPEPWELHVSPIRPRSPR